MQLTAGLCSVLFGKTIGQCTIDSTPLQAHHNSTVVFNISFLKRSNGGQGNVPGSLSADGLQVFYKTPAHPLRSPFARSCVSWPWTPFVTLVKPPARARSGVRWTCRTGDMKPNAESSRHIGFVLTAIRRKQAMSHVTVNHLDSVVSRDTCSQRRRLWRAVIRPTAMLCIRLKNHQTIDRFVVSRHRRRNEKQTTKKTGAWQKPEFIVTTWETNMIYKEWAK